MCISGEPNDPYQTLPVRKVEEERDDEIFDDGDFYQHILVEMTNRKNRNTKDMMAISKQWAELNKLRKTKKQIDQRASKGRKTRDALFKELFKDDVRVVDTGSNWMFDVLG
ncbi:hypothetical protein HELRODRAFT_160442 [Helobdella robusta]|uniref:Apoptosis-antagonizing transcription factor C-terminal domain-containing protein n=1 Tax=Helobdella robusta TaxID=6412 RepID=T1EQ93_HELRO|nr:hypothetical protein HELRODRAFT_160442 [Helobdella robusta]ESO06282.1 hypothetical protein HELRODRAFT_160442 [Helobdella robusta]